MNSWKIILATIVIYGAGVMTGGLLVSYVCYVDHSHPKNFHRPAAAANSVIQTNSASQPKPPHVPEILSKQFVEQLNDELQFTPEQRAAIEKIIADGQGQMRKAVQAVRQDAHQQIRDQLTPGQQKQFEALIKQFAPHHPPRDKTPPGFPPPTNLPPPAPGL